MTAGRYRKRPVEVDAEQISVGFMICDGSQCMWPANNPFDALVMRRPRWWKAPVTMIKTLEGWLTVSPGDWIIKGVKGEFYPCKPDIFEEAEAVGVEAEWTREDFERLVLKQ